MKIKSIEFVYGDREDAKDLEDEDERYSDRRIIVAVQTDWGVEKVTIDPCHRSYQQYGTLVGTPIEVLYFTADIARKFHV